MTTTLTKDPEQDLLFRALHDIENPLTLISSTIQLMEQVAPEVHELPYWGELKEAVKSLGYTLDRYRSSYCSQVSADDIKSWPKLLQK